MNITVIGTGYVGLITGVCFANIGHKVTCCDLVREKVDLINQGKSPFFEPKLDELLQKSIKSGNLRATTDVTGSIPNSDISFICVGTPSKSDSSIDLKLINSAAEMISKGLKKHLSFHLVTVKSTVVPGTTESLIPILQKSGKEFGLCMNPEFLKEGSAVDDFMNPDRIVIGSLNRKSEQVLYKLYSSFNCPKILTDLRTAEMIKYAANSFLATKISFINEIANICQLAGIDVKKVAEGIGFDPRIGSKFLRAGCGFGGSCFPKDVKALVSWSKSEGYQPRILESVLRVNKKQPLILVEMARKALRTLNGKNISILGLAFKPGTDDIREAPSLTIIQKLLDLKAEIKVYDPQATENVKKIFGDKLHYSASPEECLKDSEAALIVTEWEQIKNLQPSSFKSMKNRLVIDGRRVFDPQKFLDEGIEFYAIGWSR